MKMREVCDALKKKTAEMSGLGWMAEGTDWMDRGITHCGIVVFNNDLDQSIVFEMSGRIRWRSRGISDDTASRLKDFLLVPRYVEAVEEGDFEEIMFYEKMARDEM